MRLPLSAILILFLVSCGSPSDREATITVPEESVTQDESSVTPPSTADAPTSDDSVRIVFLGDSITAGYGLNTESAFPALVGMQLADAGYTVRVIDAGISGDTSSGGLNRVEWLLQERVDILVLELGGNDGLRGIDLSLTKSNLGGIIDKTRQAWTDAEIVLVGMEVPPNLGHEYTTQFASMYPEVAASHGVKLIPFIGEGFGAITHLLQNDGIHPTAEGHRIIAERVLATLEPLVSSLQP